MLSETGNVRKCCVALGISRWQMYVHRRRSAKFDEEWIAARKIAVALLEDEAWRRAFDGIEKDVWYKGVPVGKETVYSDTLLMHRLNAERPDKYQYRQKIDANVDGEIVVKVIKFADNDSK